MVCDYIKSPYTCVMRFWADDPEREVVVNWKYAKPGAKVLPFSHLFWSSVWLDQRETVPPLGEQRRIERIRGPIYSAFDGERYCGDRRVWRRGADEDTPLLRTDPDGRPLCCKGPARRFGVFFRLTSSVRRET